MNEVGFKSMAEAGFNKDNLTKQYNSQYNILPDTSYLSTNGFKMPNLDSKEILNLKKTVSRLEKNISFIQCEHNQMLKGLHNQVERLREENQELQFQLVMKAGHTMDVDSDMQIRWQSSENQTIKNAKIESDAQQILILQEALEEEKAKNIRLIQKLSALSTEKEEEKLDVSDTENTYGSQIKKHEEIEISSNIRISLAPLTLSLFHEDSGQYITNSTPSVEDCEIIIRTLLDKPQLSSISNIHEASRQSLSAQRTPLIPYIKRPLQSIKPLSRNSTPIKSNPVHRTYSTRPTGSTTNNLKLSPIVSHQNDIIKLEEETQRHGNVPPFSADSKIGCSLPALPKPADYNQADKQRRLHLLQRKRLDNYNARL